MYVVDQSETPIHGLLARGGAGVFFFLKEKGGLESRQSLWWINETVRKANINIKVLPMYVHVL